MSGTWKAKDDEASNRIGEGNERDERSHKANDLGRNHGESRLKKAIGRPIENEGRDFENRKELRLSRKASGLRAERERAIADELHRGTGHEGRNASGHRCDLDHANANREDREV